MSKQVDVLVVSAHPDDCEFSMGGTLIKLARSGASIFSLVLTESEMSTSGDVIRRKGELAAACSVVGMRYEQWNLPDTGVENTRENRIRVARLIRQLKPKIVFAQYHTNPIGELGGVAHVDHYTTGALVRDAVKMARLDKTVPDVPKHTVSRLYFYMLPRQIMPTMVVDVSDVATDLEKLIGAYESQLVNRFGGLNLRDYLMTRRINLGMDVGVRYAEAFITDIPLRMTPESIMTL